MIIDFSRAYPSIKAVTELTGTDCSLCKKPYRNSSPDAYNPTITCNKCQWTLTFDQDLNRCQKIRLFNYKNFSFCYSNSCIYIRDVNNTTGYTWGIFKRNINTISLQVILEWVRTGECREACVVIRRDEIIKAQNAAKRVAEATARQAAIDAAAIAAAHANGLVAAHGAAVNNVRVAVAA